ncbi:MAG: hypothetical protein M1815_002779 [Lichina confinis]|nr:MAG: hypothetical protein M1815_002779 [Lichina confinis]
MRSKSDSRMSSMSWPPPLYRSPSMPISRTMSRAKLRPKPLSPITEKSASKSKKTVLSAPTMHGPSSTDNLIKPAAQSGHPTSSTRHAESRRRTEQQAAVELPADQPETPVRSQDSWAEVRRQYDLQRSKSDSYKSLQVPDEKPVYGSSISRPSRPGRSVSLQSRWPGDIPQQPVPLLPTPEKRAQGKTAERLFVPVDVRSMPSPASFSSVNSSILNLGSPSPDRTTNVFSAWSSKLRDSPSKPTERDWRRHGQPAMGLASHPVAQSEHGFRDTTNVFGLDSGHGAGAQHLAFKARTSSRSDDGRKTTAYNVLGSPVRREKNPASAKMQDHRTTGLRLGADSPSTPSPPARRRVSSKRSPTISPAANESPADKDLEDSQARRSTPLRDTSGNQADPFQTRRHPRDSTPAPTRRSSDAEASPKGASSPLTPVSVLKKAGAERKKGHRRQNCVRISNLPPLILGPTSCSPISEEDGAQATPRSSIAVSDGSGKQSYSRPLPRPPSSATFDPQLSLTPRRTSDREAYLSGQLVAPSRLSMSSDRPVSHDLSMAPLNLLSWAAALGSGSSDPGSSPDDRLSQRLLAMPSSPMTPTPKHLPRAAGALDFPSPSPSSVSACSTSRFSTPSPERKRPLTGIQGPRTSPKIVRSPRTRDIRRSALALREVNSDVALSLGFKGRVSGGGCNDGATTGNHRDTRVYNSTMIHSRKAVAGVGRSVSNMGHPSTPKRETTSTSPSPTASPSSPSSRQTHRIDGNASGSGSGNPKKPEQHTYQRHLTSRETPSAAPMMIMSTVNSSSDGGDGSNVPERRPARPRAQLRPRLSSRAETFVRDSEDCGMSRLGVASAGVASAGATTGVITTIAAADTAPAGISLAQASADQPRSVMPRTVIPGLSTLARSDDPGGNGAGGPTSPDHAFPSIDPADPGDLGNPGHRGNPGNPGNPGDPRTSASGKISTADPRDFGGKATHGIPTATTTATTNATPSNNPSNTNNNNNNNNSNNNNSLYSDIRNSNVIDTNMATSVRAHPPDATPFGIGLGIQWPLPVGLGDGADAGAGIGAGDGAGSGAGAGAGGRLADAIGDTGSVGLAGAGRAGNAGLLSAGLAENSGLAGNVRATGNAGLAGKFRVVGIGSADQVGNTSNASNTRNAGNPATTANTANTSYTSNTSNPATAGNISNSGIGRVIVSVGSSPVRAGGEELYDRNGFLRT